MKIIKPWRELNMVNIYLKRMVSELKLNNPNSQVIPSNGRMTPEALTPVLTFSTCVLFCMYFVPIIWRITKMKTTILTCKSYRNCMNFSPIIWRITRINTTISTCKSCKILASNLETTLLFELQGGKCREHFVSGPCFTWHYLMAFPSYTRCYCRVMKKTSDKFNPIGDH